jgi:hypothetical protein
MRKEIKNFLKVRRGILENPEGYLREMGIIVRKDGVMQRARKSKKKRFKS